MTVKISLGTGPEKSRSQATIRGKLPVKIQGEPVIQASL